LLQHPVARKTVNYLLVDRDAKGERKSVVSFKSGFSPVTPDKFLGQFIQDDCPDTRCNNPGNLG